jgi:hypothetical protein
MLTLTLKLRWKWLLWGQMKAEEGKLDVSSIAAHLLRLKEDDGQPMPVQLVKVSGLCSHPLAVPGLSKSYVPMSSGLYLLSSVTTEVPQYV